LTPPDPPQTEGAIVQTSAHPIEPATLAPDPQAAWPIRPSPDTDPDPGPLRLADTRAVVERYRTMVYGIALTHTRCRGDADDVFQDVFLAYHRRQPRLRSEEHRKAWLIAATLNCAKAVASASWRTRVVPMTLDDMEAAAPTVFTFDNDAEDAIFRALAAIPEDFRTVLHLFYFEDLPIAQIAVVLDLQPGAVKMRLSRGRAAMRDQLQGALFDD
jgi:RNA polymerase sigma-70 factor (ECF subfamily)